MLLWSCSQSYKLVIEVSITSLGTYQQGENMTTINVETKPCPFCNIQHYVEVDSKDLNAWLNKGLHVQDAFPYLGADDREMLLTGTCASCWDEHFSEEDDE